MSTSNVRRYIPIEVGDLLVDIQHGNWSAMVSKIGRVEGYKQAQTYVYINDGTNINSLPIQDVLKRIRAGTWELQKP
jgi:hypothetical protein